MRTCPTCKSLVPPDAETCPEARGRCPLFSETAPPSAPTEVRTSSPEADPVSIESLGIEGAEAMPDAIEDTSRSTVQLSAEQMRELLPASQPTPRESARPTADPSPDTSASPRASSSPKRRNQAARLGFQLGALSVLPFFPIGFVAVMVSLIGLSRARDFEQPERQKALAGLLAGLIFGTVWLVLTLWLLNDIIIERP